LFSAWAVLVNKGPARSIQQIANGNIFLFIRISLLM
jgi:hypothetical protein